MLILEIALGVALGIGIAKAWTDIYQALLVIAGFLLAVAAIAAACALVFVLKDYLREAPSWVLSSVASLFMAWVGLGMYRQRKIVRWGRVAYAGAMIGVGSTALLWMLMTFT